MTGPRLFGLPALCCLLVLLPAGCGGGGSGRGGGAAGEKGKLVVDSTEDLADPPAGVVTLRSAVARVRDGGKILFDESLDGATIHLTEVDAEHSVLVGETFPMGQFAGFGERDYGRSALYAAKDLTIDASMLPNGITLRWDGPDGDDARVLALYGDLTLINVAVTGGRSVAVPIAEGDQPFTLGRGGGLAVWGTATLVDCDVYGNRAEGDETPSRDRGAFGGGVYANRVEMTGCAVSGNRVRGYGAAGGGVYSVGGAETFDVGSVLDRCTLSGNRVTGQHAYGGGLYTDGGGPGRTQAVRLANCTVAGNLVEDHPDLPEAGQWYTRGGGIYMSNGILEVAACTVAGNAVTGHPAVFRGRPNLGGGGIAATIGDAHVVDHMRIGHSIVVGNTVGGEPGDLYTGSLVQFFSDGYNLVGDLDMSQMLVPIPPWWSLSRKHWPEVGDLDGLAPDQALDLPGAVFHPLADSAGVGEGGDAVLYYPPAGNAEDRIPRSAYRTGAVLAQRWRIDEEPGVLLNEVLARLRADHGDVLGEDFGEHWGDLSGVPFLAVPDEWPSEEGNAEWIAFWRDLEAGIDGRLGTVGLGDDFWASWGRDLQIDVMERKVRLQDGDQRGRARPAGTRGDIGAIEE